MTTLLTGPIYETKFCSVSARLFKTRRRTYQISRIEKTELRRPLFVPLSMVGLAFFAFLWKFKPYLFESEYYVGMVVCGALFAAAWEFGVLFVHSKALSEPALYGLITTLRPVREAIDRAIEETDLVDRRSAALAQDTVDE